MSFASVGETFGRGRAAVGRWPHDRRGGMVLVIVLIVIVLLALAGYTFSNVMLTERKAAVLSCRRAQAAALADSGVEAARAVLLRDKAALRDAGGWYDNPTLFRGVLVADDSSSVERGRFAVVAPRVDDGVLGGIRFGLENESTRLNLNAVLLADRYAENGARQLLMGLPGMTEEIADAALDWLDEDDEPREFGAEADHYSSLDPPYAPKNGPMETVEELLLVRGVTPALVFGTDANRNHLPDRDEPPADAIEGADNADGAMNGGWASYLTLYSLETNLRPDGRAKVDLNQDDMEALYGELVEAVGPPWATFLVAYRQNGPYTGSKPGLPAIAGGQLDLSKPGRFPVNMVLDLIDVRTQVTFVGDNGPTVLESPFPNIPGLMSGYLPMLLDQVSATPSPLIPGRINIEQAPRAILLGIPGMNETIVDAILSQRHVNPVDSPDHRRHETWLLAEGLVTLEEMKALEPFVTCGGDVFRGQFIGYYDGGGPAARLEVVLDATAAPVRIVSWRDLSHLGRGYLPETLGVAVE